MRIVLGTIKEKKKLVGYRVYDVKTQECRDYPVELIREMNELCIDGEYQNAEYVKVAGLLKGKGQALQEYATVIYPTYLAQPEKKKLLLIGKVKDKVTKKEEGYRVLDAYGVERLVLKDTLLALGKLYTGVNYRCKVEKGEITIETESEWLFESTQLLTGVQKRSFKSGEGETRDKVSSELFEPVLGSDLPVLKVYNYDDLMEYTTEDEISKTQYKIELALQQIRSAYPYLGLLLKTIKKSPVQSIETAAASEREIYYNPKFVLSLSQGELNFVLLHELYHVMMNHVSRRGKRDAEKWNIACDLYINTLICDETNSDPDGARVLIPPFKSDSGNPLECEIKPISDGIYIRDESQVFDLSIETPETIYAELVEEEDSEEEEEEEEEGEEGAEGSSEGAGGGSGQGQGEKEREASEGDGSKKVAKDGSSLSDSIGEGKESKGKVYKYKGGKVGESKGSGDLVSEFTSEEDPDGERSKQASTESSTLMDMAKAMEEEKTGKKFSLVGMEQAGERAVAYNLSTKLNWRQILKRVLTVVKKKQYTLATPNSTYANMGTTVADRRKIKNTERLKEIKVCIDTSGSVSQAELEEYLGEVSNILNSYEVEGELIYWSVGVDTVGSFKNLRELLGVKVGSKGGTDVQGLFEYLANEGDYSKLNSKRTKPRDITCILILTDGYFSENYTKYRELLGRKVIWVLTEENRSFNPPFGKVTQLNQ